MARPVRDPPETLEPSHDDPSSTIIRPPTTADARSMWQLAKDSGGLDLNSPYAYVLGGYHFAGTSVVAETSDGVLCGFVLAYPPPNRPDSVFVWQVAVSPDQRGTGIAKRMVHEVVDREIAGSLPSYLTATVTPSNDASRRLFTAVARDRNAPFDERPCLAADLFPGTDHEPENEIVIGPIDRADTTTTLNRKDQS